MLEVSWELKDIGRIKRLYSGVGVVIRKRLGLVGRMIKKEIYINLSGRVLHTRSDTLRKSWRRHITSTIPGGYRLYLWSEVPYARIHEYGGMTGRGHKTRIPARPYVGSAMTRLNSKIVWQLEDALHQAVRRL